MLICERIMPSSIRFVIIFSHELAAILLIAALTACIHCSQPADAGDGIEPGMKGVLALQPANAGDSLWRRSQMKTEIPTMMNYRLLRRLDVISSTSYLGFRALRSTPGFMLAPASAGLKRALRSTPGSMLAPASAGLKHEDSRVSMGCVYTIVVYGRDMEPLRDATAAALDEVDRIDRLMSHYKSESQLSLVNREAANSPVKVDPELFDFIAECLLYGRESEGAFDITVGPLMKAWGFFRGEGRMPTDAELADARNRIGYQHVILNQKEGTIHFDKAGVELDLGGIAKGYAVDRAVAVLKRHGVSSALVSAGGSTIYALGAPPGKASWEIKVQDPVDQNRIAMAVRLKDQAFSVSGSYEKFFELDGVRYSHVMDPRTGRPVQGVLSVAVITDDGMSGDALDNVFYVLGVERGRDNLSKFSASEAIFFLPDRNRRWRMVRIQKSTPRRNPL
jgi:thiamine biosynthesis lipoprotein